MTESYLYPEEKEEIIKKFEGYKINITNDYWLYKPHAGTYGSGIHFLKNFESLNLSSTRSFILNKYIKNTLVINKKKFDMRAYLLVTGVDPLKMYFYHDGYLRLATENYDLNISKINRKYIHITNTFLNEKHRFYKLSQGLNDTNGSDWSFYLFEQYCKNNSINFNDIKNQIKDIMIKIFIPHAIYLSKQLKQKNLNDKNFFQIFGLDFMVDINHKVYFLEMNYHPSIYYEHKTKEYIFNHLIVDTLNLVGVVPYAHDSTNLPFDKDIYKYENNIDEAVDDALCEFGRPRGKYELIFPTKENVNKYKKYIEEVSEANKLLWEKIMKDEY